MILSSDKVEEAYHFLRQAALSARLADKGPLPAFRGLARHLFTNGGDYQGLLEFLDWRGRRYLYPAIRSKIRRHMSSFKQVVDLGAGTGWLGEELAKDFAVEVIYIDKRPLREDTIVLDVETPEGLSNLEHLCQGGCLVFMCEFLHCISNPLEVFGALRSNHLVVVSYTGWNGLSWSSYAAQVHLYGATPMHPTGIIEAASHTHCLQDSPRPASIGAAHGLLRFFPRPP